MKLKPFLLFLALASLFFCPQKTTGQILLNGDFENNTASPCAYNLSNAGFTSLMANATGYGAAQELDIMSSCPYGTAISGTWFVGLAGWTDAFTLNINVPLITGNTYAITYWDKGNSTYPPVPPPIIGLSTVPNAAGTNIYVGPTPTLDIWNQRTFSFVAPNPGPYLSVAVNAWRWLHIDGMQFTSPPLPLELTEFNATLQGGQVYLDWATASEINHDHFVVERRKVDEPYFEEVTEVAGRNASSRQAYVAVDTQPYPGPSYYRLRLVDRQGASEYSHLRQVTYYPDEYVGVKVYPNPTDGPLVIEVDADDETAFDIIIYDVMGRPIELPSGWRESLLYNRLEVDLRAQPKGVYFVHVTTPSAVTIKKVILSAL